MALEQLYKYPLKLAKLRSGPLCDTLGGFCDALLEEGFRPSTIRKHLGCISHLNEYLDSRRDFTGQPLTEQILREFLRDYPAKARVRGSLDEHIRCMKWSLNRFARYLRASGRFEEPVNAMTEQPLLGAYLRWLKEYQGAAPGTIDLRARHVSQFLQWLGPQATPQDCSELTPATVEGFFLNYAKHKGRSSQRSMQAALRTFLRFCLQQGYIQQPLGWAVPRLCGYQLSTVARGLSEEQAQELLRSIDRGTPAGRRDYAICQLLYTYGVRGGQVRALRLQDIDWAGNQILFRALKHGKDSLLPLTQEVGESLLDYLQNARPCFPEPRLFLTLRPPYHGLDSSGVVSSIIARHVQVAGFDIAHKGAHIFRHGFATRMLAQGHSLKAIADVLGHRHLGSTAIYTKVDFHQLEQVALPWPGEVAS